MFITYPPRYPNTALARVGELLNRWRTTRRLLGSLVRRHLGVFLQRLIEFIDCQHEQELQQKNTLAQPITVTTTTREEDKTCTRSRPIPAS